LAAFLPPRRTVSCQPQPSFDRRTNTSLFSWLRNWTSTPPSRGRVPHQHAARRFRPRLEALEERWLPSTLTVTNNLDSGAGSLRADIAAAKSGDTIVFAPSLDGKTITLTSGMLSITTGMTIQGPGASLLTISGNHLSQVFHVTGAQPVVLSGLTISNGKGIGIFGSGIFNSSTLTVSQCTVSGNLGTNGGGIFNLGTLTVSGCTIAGNRATYGGGIYNAGKLTVSQSTLNDNFAMYGGGIYNNSGNGTFRYAKLINCTLSENATTGAVLNAGGGLFSFSGSLSLTNCTISNNRSYSGGAGIVIPSFYAVSFTNTIIAGNYDNYGSADMYLGGFVTMNNCLLGTGVPTNGPNGVGNIFIDSNDPGLGPLQNNGGPTQTMALLPGSLAIGHADNSKAPTKDERGVSRSEEAGETTDIGAFEL
jgi:hypothetical protein